MSTPEAGAEPGARGVRQLVAADFSVADAIGGWRGLVESIAPGLGFVVVYVATHEITPSLVASLAVAGVAVIARLATRSPLTQAFSGVVGVLIGVVWAWRSGEAEDYFAWGLVTNVLFAVGMLVSILVRWPAVGVVVGLIRQTGTGWRSDPGHVRRYTIATWFWFGLFAVRLAVQVPLYLNAEVAWLGSARLVMGVPLWALTLWLTWILVREPAGPAARPAPQASPPTR
ncbi:MAG TPA: DUF3159 domain-containing protein [Actinotalea sp.]|nr:DUF3159 domain-containing protein [Actinotalea sp.]